MKMLIITIHMELSFIPDTLGVLFPLKLVDLFSPFPHFLA